jgi:tRNA dimethylallyltransferase
MKKIIIFTGQTATGKTDLALHKAVQENAEIINCDSRQIYKYLDIISGKDLTNTDYHEQYKINNFSIGYYNFDTSFNHLKPRLWLYDIITPKDYFSSFDFQTCAIDVIQKIFKEKDTLIIVGGTYFYLYHLLYSIKTQEIPPNWELREELKNASVEELQNKLKNINTNLFTQLNESEKKNPQRLIRKIEISLIDKNFNQNDLETKITLKNKLHIDDLQIEYIGLRYKDKDAERKSILERVEKRMKQGAVEEVESILAQGYTEHDPGMKTIGYQQMISYIQGTYTKEEMLEDWLNKELQYAKRQFTFMKRDSNIQWQEVK